MFTGIIQKVAVITRSEQTAASLKIAIKNDLKNVQLGESIAINGVCLTVTEIGEELDFFVGYETLTRSNLKNLKAGAKVNIERALMAGERLTIAAIQNNEISIMLIPHTWDHTNLSAIQSGDLVNVEVDVLAKYMEKLCQPYFKQLTT
jgi:riboflavin synthase